MQKSYKIEWKLYKIEAIFTNSINSETSDSYRLLLNLTDKINLKRSDKFFALSNLSIYYTWKNIKKSCKNKKFKMSAPTWNKEIKLPDHILYQLFKINLNISLKALREKTDNRSMRINVNIK